MDIHPLPAAFFGLSFRRFRWLLRLVSLPQSRAKYSPFATPIFLSCPFSAALSVFLSFFLSFPRLFRCPFRFLRQRRKAAECVCHTLFPRVLHAGGRSQVGGLRPTKTPPTWVQTYLRSTVVQAVLLSLFCFHGGFHDTSLNQVSMHGVNSVCLSNQ